MEGQTEDPPPQGTQQGVAITGAWEGLTKENAGTPQEGRPSGWWGREFQEGDVLVGQ